MDNRGFLKLCSALFRDNSFICKGKNYYYDGHQGVSVVFGLQKSNYGPYYYMEHGFAFSAINKHFPFPKHNELDINLGRIMFPFGKMLHYETMNESDCKAFVATIQEKINTICPIINQGKEKIIDQYIFSKPDEISYILSSTAEFLEIDMQHFRDHHIGIVTVY